MRGNGWTRRKRRSREGRALKNQFQPPGPSRIPVLGLGDSGELEEERRGEHHGEVVRRCPSMTYGKDLTQATPHSGQSVQSPGAEQAVVSIVTAAQARVVDTNCRSSSISKERLSPLRGWVSLKLNSSPLYLRHHQS